MTTRNSPCTCGSGKRFKHCGGGLTPEPERALERQDATPYTKFGYFQERYRGQGMMPYVEDMPARRWVRSMDRDFSVLVYTNDDYEGGTLYFQNFDIRIKPSRGMPNLGWVGFGGRW